MKNNFAVRLRLIGDDTYYYLGNDAETSDIVNDFQSATKFANSDEAEKAINTYMSKHSDEPVEQFQVVSVELTEDVTIHNMITHSDVENKLIEYEKNNNL